VIYDSLCSLTDQQSVFKRYNSKKHLWELYPQNVGETSWHRYGTKLRHCHPIYVRRVDLYAKAYLCRWGGVWLAASRRWSLLVRSMEQCQRSNGKYSASLTHCAEQASVVTSAVTWPETLTDACALETSSSNRLRSASLQQTQQNAAWLDVNVNV